MADSLFADLSTQPLAARMRPESLDDFAGQEHLIGEGKILRRIIDSDRIPSMIFWGPPGVGKTTLASIIARKTKAGFITFSAVTGGIKEIREVMKQADSNRNFGTRTIVFVDEIHRFNKAQQDAFLPFVERGSIILIGATTENPSFEVNGALLSRCKVFVLKPLGVNDIVKVLKRGIKILGVNADDNILTVIADFSNGDARSAISLLEMAAVNSDGIITPVAPGPSTGTIKVELKKEGLGTELYNNVCGLAGKDFGNKLTTGVVYVDVTVE